MTRIFTVLKYYVYKEDELPIENELLGQLDNFLLAHSAQYAQLLLLE